MSADTKDAEGFCYSNCATPPCDTFIEWGFCAWEEEQLQGPVEVTERDRQIQRELDECRV